MKTKVCFKCSKRKPIRDFYKHSMTTDGHLGKCKKCTKKDTISNRRKNKNYYNQYDRDRASLPHRVELRKKNYKKWQRDPELRKKLYGRCAVWRIKNKIKHAAHLLTYSAIKKGSLVKFPCEICRNKIVDAHHDDYTKPLEVRWLCKKHHAEYHKKEREKLRNK